jgi:circadian clock protein KaiC
LGASLDELTQNGLTLIYTSPVELQIDSLVGTIFQKVSQGEVARVVIDAVGDLQAAADNPERLYDFLYALTQHFSARDVTSVLTYELREVPVRISSMCDNVLLLGMDIGVKASRSLRIVKTRGSGHDLVARELEIGDSGARVL